MERADVAHSTDTLISLTGAGVERAGRWLVRGVDLTVHPGEIVTLIGPNGSGKSTTAKMALGILKPDEGNAARRPALVVGYVPQKVSVDWTLPLTVGRFMHLTGRVSRAEADAAMTATGIRHLIGAEVRTLSGGEFQRVLLARAIARKPDLLVLDEPVQGVDFSGEIALYDLIKRIRDDIGCGILLISHDLHVVMSASDRVICMNGHICCEGTPENVASAPEYRALFGSGTHGALALYRHTHTHSHEDHDHDHDHDHHHHHDHDHDHDLHGDAQPGHQHDGNCHHD